MVNEGCLISSVHTVVFALPACEVEGVIYGNLTQFVHPSNPCLRCDCQVSRRVWFTNVAALRTCDIV